MKTRETGRKYGSLASGKELENKRKEETGEEELSCEKKFPVIR